MCLGSILSSASLTKNYFKLFIINRPKKCVCAYDKRAEVARQSIPSLDPDWECTIWSLHKSLSDLESTTRMDLSPKKTRIGSD